MSCLNRSSFFHSGTPPRSPPSGLNRAAHPGDIAPPRLPSAAAHQAAPRCRASGVLSFGLRRGGRNAGGRVRGSGWRICIGRRLDCILLDSADNCEQPLMGRAEPRRFFQRQKGMPLRRHQLAFPLQCGRQFQVDFRRIKRLQKQQRLIAVDRQGVVVQRLGRRGRRPVRRGDQRANREPPQRGACVPPPNLPLSAIVRSAAEMLRHRRRTAPPGAPAPHARPASSFSSR